MKSTGYGFRTLLLLMLVGLKSPVWIPLAFGALCLVLLSLVVVAEEKTETPEPKP